LASFQNRCAMPHSPALAYAEAGGFSQMRAFAGDVLYTEGMPALHLYVVKEGEVDLFLMRDEKRTVVETLRRGQCFGFEPHLAQPVRLHGAAARSFCELYVVDNPSAMQALAPASDLLWGLLLTASERLAAAHELVARRVSFQPELLAYAQLLQLAGLAEPDLAAESAGAMRRRPGATEAPALARPLVQTLVNQAKLLFGHSDRHVRACLGKLASLHLVRVDDGPQGKQLVYAPRDILAQVRKAVASDSEAPRQSHQYLNLDDFAALVEVDRGTLLRKLAGGEFAEDLFTFRREEILRLLDSKGRRFFAERRLKAPAEFEVLDDLEFADARAVFDAVARLDSFEVAKLLHGLAEGGARSKILGSLSARRRSEVESDLQGLAAVDAIEVQRLGEALVREVRDAMLRKAA
jgi:CRP-like cAMP-binding protein